MDHCVFFRGACIRLTADGPVIHVNSAHANVGVTSVAITADGDLEILTDVPEGSKIIAAIAEEDESLSALGIQAGVSGGISRSVVKFYKGTTRVRADSPTFGAYSNVWFSLMLLAPDPQEWP